MVVVVVLGSFCVGGTADTTCAHDDTADASGRSGVVVVMIGIRGMVVVILVVLQTMTF